MIGVAVAGYDSVVWLGQVELEETLPIPLLAPVMRTMVVAMVIFGVLFVCICVCC